MNINDELIIKYLSGELDENEKISFELQLNKSGELKKLVKNYSLVFDKFAEQNVIEGNDFYFNNLLTRVRRSADNIRLKFTFKGFAYSITILLFTFISYVVFNSYNSQIKTNSLDSITEKISRQQISAIIDKYSLIDNADFYNTNLDSLFDNEMNSVYNDAALQAADDMQIEELTNRLSESEINLVYTDLITKKFYKD